MGHLIVCVGLVLSHLKSIGIRSKAYRLLCSYLSNRSLFVVANSNASSCWKFTAGAPQEEFGSLYCLTCTFVSLAFRFYIVIYFNMLTMHLLWRWFRQRRNELRLLKKWMLNWIACWPWNINFEPANVFHCVYHLSKILIVIPLLFMAIEEVESLKILGSTLIEG